MSLLDRAHVGETVDSSSGVKGVALNLLTYNGSLFLV